MARNEFQLLVRLLDNKTLTLHFPIQQAPVPVQSIKQQIQSITEIPSQFQKLTLNGKFISDETEIHKTHSLSTINLTFSLVGGKGGFGSLLRGAATKAGQKKTNNFDACRDMSGRRLRHVNAEKRLEEWKAEEEDRRLEKMADEYLKKMAKTAKKEGRNGSGNGAAERYVEKYREVSERCVKDVERSVRESAAELMVGKKRKLLERLRKKDVKEDGETKKLKTGNGKRTIGESDDDDDDDDDDSDEDFLDDIHIKEDEVKGKRIGCGGCLLPDTSSEDDNETVTRESSTSSIDGIALNVSLFPDVYGSIESISDSEVQKDDHGEKALGAAPQGMSSSPEIVETEKGDSGTCIVTIEPSTVSNKVEAHLGSQDVEAASGVDEVLAADAEKLNDESSIQPLNFNDYSSAAELEVLGLERLKLELQSRGLKCGGTLQERAARLFLLKITPIEKLPKKLLAKK